MTTWSKLESSWANSKSVCVGLDPDLTKFPTHLLEGLDIVDQLFNFFGPIIDATGDLVAAFKPNFAFFERFGFAGMRAYQMICGYIKDKFPDVFLIADTERGDIDKTNLGSVEFIFDVCGADAVTVNPFPGQEEGVQPFLDRVDKCVFVWCRSSNKGAEEFQDLWVHVNGKDQKVFIEHGSNNLAYDMQLYQVVAARVNGFWNKNGNCGLVVGATYPKEIGKVRDMAPELPLLLPGIGTQGGDLEASMLAAGKRFLISSSSSVTYASTGKDFAQATRQKVVDLNTQIHDLLAKFANPVS